MLNLLVQITTLGNALLFSFLAPAAYGLALYGEFIGLNAVVFLLHRAFGIISEPLIRFAGAGKLIYSVLLLSLLTFVGFLALHFLTSVGSPLLLFSMLLSASVLLVLQGLRLRRAYILFVSLAALLLAALTAWSYTHDLSISLERVMEISVLIPACIWLVVALRASDECPSLKELQALLAQLANQIPQLLTVTAVMNLLTAALPVYLARVLVPYDLGLYRVASSVIQSATSVFPVSTAAVIARFTSHAQGKRLYRTLRSFATLYFSIIATGLILLASLAPTLTPYLVLCASIPVYYRAVLDERHLIAANRSLWLMAINITVVLIGLGSLFLIHTLENAMLYYACIVTGYAGLMQLLRKNILAQMPSLLMIMACPFAVTLMAREPAFGLFYLALLVLVEWMQDHPTRTDLVWLWREM